MRFLSLSHTISHFSNRRLHRLRAALQPSKLFSFVTRLRLITPVVLMNWVRLNPLPDLIVHHRTSPTGHILGSDCHPFWTDPIFSSTPDVRSPFLMVKSSFLMAESPCLMLKNHLYSPVVPFQQAPRHSVTLTAWPKAMNCVKYCLHCS